MKILQHARANSKRTPFYITYWRRKDQFPTFTGIQSVGGEHYRAFIETPKLDMICTAYWPYSHLQTWDSMTQTGQAHWLWEIQQVANFALGDAIKSRQPRRYHHNHEHWSSIIAYWWNQKVDSDFIEQNGIVREVFYLVQKRWRCTYKYGFGLLIVLLALIAQRL